MQNTQNEQNEQMQFILDNPHFSYETLELKDKLTKLENIIKEKELELDKLRTQKEEFLLTGVPPDLAVLNTTNIDKEYQIIRQTPYLNMRTGTVEDRFLVQIKIKMLLTHFTGKKYFSNISGGFKTMEQAEAFAKSWLKHYRE